MVERDRVERVEAVQIVLERRVVAVPRYHIKTSVVLFKLISIYIESEKK
jgi:hypothetical protein